MKRLASVIRARHDPRRVAPDIAALHGVPALEPQPGHELVQQPRRVLQHPVSFDGRRVGEGVAWEGGDDDVVGEVLGGVLGLQG